MQNEDEFDKEETTDHAIFAEEKMITEPQYIGSMEWYKDNWKAASVKTDPATKSMIDYSVNQILRHRSRYEQVQNKIGNMPWWLIGAIHGLESSFNWITALHNGDRLFNNNGVPIKTVHVPSGRGPFSSWEEAALDALKMKNAHLIKSWPIEQSLHFSERYNGTGYLRFHLKVPSPYLWSGTNLYTKGKYVADGKFDDNAISKQLGIAAVAKDLEAKKIIRIEYAA